MDLKPVFLDPSDRTNFPFIVLKRYKKYIFYIENINSIPNFKNTPILQSWIAIRINSNLTFTLDFSRPCLPEAHLHHEHISVLDNEFIQCLLKVLSLNYIKA